MVEYVETISRELRKGVLNSLPGDMLIKITRGDFQIYDFPQAKIGWNHFIFLPCLFIFSFNLFLFLEVMSPKFDLKKLTKRLRQGHL